MTEASRKGGRLRWSLNGFVLYLKTLVVVTMLLVGARLIFTDSMVIYAQNEKLDFLQVFYLIDGVYNEENSERSAPFENSENGVRIRLPFASFDRVRIDPANEIGEIVIKKIELRGLFGRETYMPTDLLAQAKPIQMIDKLEATSAGLLIRSTGNDPAFELQINRWSLFSQFFLLCFISVFLSLVVFFFVKKFAYLKMPKISDKVYLLVIPLVLSLGIAALFYPGFMSYDTLHALRGARNGVTDSEWPPMVSYVWRVVDLVSHNPSAMHFSQVFLLLFSVFWVVFFFTKKIKYATVFLIIYLSVPVVLGTVAVIWKDVLMASFFMAGFAVIVSMRAVMNRKKFVLLLLLSVFLIFLGVCSRHNAIVGAVPLIFYLAWVLCSRVFKTPLRLWLGVILIGVILTGTGFYTKTLLDNYSLPSFEKMKSSTDVFIRNVRVLDVAGASLCVGSNLFADMAPSLSLAEIQSLYDPKHINLSVGLLSKVGTDSRIDKIWLDVLVRHPICILNNKFQLTKYLIGVNQGAQFLITAPSVDDNEYGYSLPESSLRDSVVSYIVSASSLPFFKPWFLYILSIASFVYMIRIRALTAGHLIIFMSAIFYFASLVLFGNAADARLPFYTTTAILVFVFISIIARRIRL